MNGNLQRMTSTQIARMDSPPPRQSAASAAAPDAPPASSSESGFGAVFSAQPQMLSPESEASLTAVPEQEEIDLSEDITLSEDDILPEDIVPPSDAVDMTEDSPAEPDALRPEIEVHDPDAPPAEQTPQVEASPAPRDMPTAQTMGTTGLIPNAAGTARYTETPKRHEADLTTARPLPTAPDLRQNPHIPSRTIMPQDPPQAPEGGAQPALLLQTAQHRAWMPAATSDRDMRKGTPVEDTAPTSHAHTIRPSTTTNITQTAPIAPSDLHAAQVDKALKSERDMHTGLHIDPSESIEQRGPHATMPMHSVHMTTQTSRSDSAAPHVINQLTAAVIAKPNGETEIALHPEELGRLRLKMHSTETGALTIVISAERTDTADLLRRNLSDLQAELATMGLGDTNISFAEHSEQSERTQHDQSPAFGTEDGSSTGTSANKDRLILAHLGPVDSLDLRL